MGAKSNPAKVKATNKHKPDRPYPQFTPTTEELIMEAQNQQDAIRNLIDNVYQRDLKAFLTDLAEIAETDSEVIEALWECAQMIPNDPSRPK